MRKLAILLTSLLLVGTLVLIAGSLNLIPLPFAVKTIPIQFPQIDTTFPNTEVEEIVQSIPATANLTVRSSYGSITVTNDNTDEFQITMIKTAKSPNPLKAIDLLEAIVLTVEDAKDTVTLKIATPKTKANEQTSADLIITVPVGTRLNLATELGDIKIHKAEGSLQAYTDLGQIIIQDFQGNGALETSLGNISIASSSFKEELTARTSLGNLIIQASLGKVNVLESELGNIELALASDEAYILDGRIELGKFTSQLPFTGQQDKEKIVGILGEGEQKGSLSVNMEIGNLKITTK